MNCSLLLKEIKARGATLTINGDRVTVKPKHALDDALRADIKRLKPELVKVLSAPPLPDPTGPAQVERVKLARECGAIVSAFPKGGAHMTEKGNWLIHGTKYSHSQALQLVETVTARRNGELSAQSPATDFVPAAAYRQNGITVRIESIDTEVQPEATP